MKRYNATLRNLEYRLRAFREYLPDYLEEAVRNREEAIVSAIANDQQFRRGVNGHDVKIWSYCPYSPSTIREKKRKGQPSTRVTLRDTGEFHGAMHIVYEPDGFSITSDSFKTKYLVPRYGETIFRLTDKNFTRIVRSHIRKDLAKMVRRALKSKV